jgi:hypothetical protein
MAGEEPELLPPNPETLWPAGILPEPECDPACPIHGSSKGCSSDDVPVLDADAGPLPTGDTELIDDARRETQRTIEDTFREPVNADLPTISGTLIDALPSTGKSYGTIEAAAATGVQITVLTARKDLYDQYRQWAEAAGLSFKRVPVFHDHCETATGEYGDEWKDRVLGWRSRGVTPRAMHKFGDLPCQRGDETCTYSQESAFDAADFDVLAGHYTQAHLGKVVKDRTVILDEFPGDSFVTRFAGNDLSAKVTRWLETADAVPFDSYEDLLENRGDENRRQDALEWFHSGGIQAGGDRRNGGREATHVRATGCLRNTGGR